MLQTIIGFIQDEEHQWVAILTCGHGQHVRHNPPWQLREWTQNEAGRASQLGKQLNCLKCERNEPATYKTNNVDKARL